MIKDFYKDELLALSAIRSERNVILNTKYKLMNDQNVRSNLKLIPEYIDDKESIPFNHKFRFEKSLSEILQVINSLFYTLLKSDKYNQLDADSLKEKCRHFPDSGGIQLMYLFGHISVLELLESKLNYEKAISESECDPNKPFIGDKTVNEEQRIRLFDEEKFYFVGLFPDEKHFEDKDLIFEHAVLRAKEYEEFKKDEINTYLSIILEQINNAKDKFDIMVKMGSIYWDAKREQKSKKDKEMRGMFKSMIESLAKRMEEDE